MIQIINCIENSEEEYLFDSADAERIKENAAILQDHVMMPLGFIRSSETE